MTGEAGRGSAARPFSAWERAIAWRYLFAKRSQGGVALISAISFIAIALAVGALIITMSIMNGFRSELSAKILGFNGHAFVVDAETTAADRGALIARLKAVPGVIQAIPVIESQVLAQGPIAASGAVVRGVTPQDLRATPIVAGNIKSGSIANFGLGEDGGDEVVVGSKLAESLGVGVGDTISLISPSGGETVFGDLPPSKSYRVAAIFQVGMSEYDQTFLYMPLAQAQLFFGRGQAVDFIEIRLRDPDRAPALKPALAAAAGPGAVVSDWTERNRAYFGALQVEHNVMRMIFMFIVALAALNIISGLIMLVKNKGRDIAILRTMGASRGAILRIFFMAGASIGVAGTLAGLLFGVVFCLNIESIQRFIEWITGVQIFNADVYFLTHVPERIDPLEVAGVSLWALGSAFIFTLLPAWRASRLDPVEALRYE
ncbi:MAG: lipoprotein-releasing ABC transporter permease subunit [Alphaproteobacteria bacterium]|nr:lipoprotein-releasing ABC transporter permease subunit [Alphaproteobacteria bacterium]